MNKQNYHEKYHNKKDNYHSKYNSFYCSREWQQLRQAKFDLANGLCEMCRKEGVIREGKEVHHIIKISQDWSKRLDFDNLILLCPEHHNLMHERISPLQKFLKDWENL